MIAVSFTEAEAQKLMRLINKAIKSEDYEDELVSAFIEITREWTRMGYYLEKEYRWKLMKDLEEEEKETNQD